MTYLSKGLLLRRSGEMLTISHCGAEYDLTGERASVWEKGRCGCDETMGISQHEAMYELAKLGLAEMSQATGDGAFFRLLINCVICPDKGGPATILWNPNERRLWQWITRAGLRLTIAELVFLMQQDIKPTAELLGEANRQTLTEAIYTTETIPDGILESRMEQSRARDSTVRAVLSLLRKNRIFLI